MEHEREVHSNTWNTTNHEHRNKLVVVVRVRAVVLIGLVTLFLLLYATWARFLEFQHRCELSRGYMDGWHCVLPEATP